jgi:hypothetical protein
MLRARRLGRAAIDAIERRGRAMPGAPDEMTMSSATGSCTISGSGSGPAGMELPIAPPRDAGASGGSPGGRSADAIHARGLGQPGRLGARRLRRDAKAGQTG